jgi:hypothetical protein
MACYTTAAQNTTICKSKTHRIFWNYTRQFIVNLIE